MGAPPYAVHGPYAVGVRDFVIDSGENALHVTVWYPALNPHHAEEKIDYEINTALPAVQTVWYPPLKDQPGKLTVKGHALQGADADMSHAPYPLVVVAGGWANFSQTYAYLKEHLASFGFVVISWDIRAEDYDSFWAGAALRPLDIQRVIDYADQLTASGGALAGLIDSQRLAVAGHSSGGMSALWEGGAQMSFGWCEAHAKEIEDFTDCSQFPGHKEEIAKMLGLSSVPQGLWPPQRDSRVKAIVALAPDGDIWGANWEGLAPINVPTLMMAGSHDTIQKPSGVADMVYPHIGTTQKSYVVLENADHLAFFATCDDAPWMRETIDWACSEPVWDRERAHDLIDHFVTSFLLAELNQDADAAKALAPENVDFPGIRYQTTEFAKP